MGDWAGLIREQFGELCGIGWTLSGADVAVPPDWPGSLALAAGRSAANSRRVSAGPSALPASTIAVPPPSGASTTRGSVVLVRHSATRQGCFGLAIGSGPGLPAGPVRSTVE
jgi:hypothetical protein